MRVDNLVHVALSTCETPERLTALLSRMQLNLTTTVQIFPSWLRLYKHLRTSSHFDVTISEYVFERLEEMNMDTCGEALAHFLFDLFDLWPLLEQIDMHRSVQHHLVHFIQILINHQTHDSNCYVDFVLKKETTGDDDTLSSLLAIVKYVSMYTDVGHLRSTCQRSADGTTDPLHSVGQGYAIHVDLRDHHRLSG